MGERGRALTLALSQPERGLGVGARPGLAELAVSDQPFELVTEEADVPLVVL